MVESGGRGWRHCDSLHNRVLRFFIQAQGFDIRVNSRTLFEQGHGPSLVTGPRDGFAGWVLGFPGLGFGHLQCQSCVSRMTLQSSESLEVPTGVWLGFSNGQRLHEKVILLWVVWELNSVESATEECHKSVMLL